MRSETVEESGVSGLHRIGREDAPALIAYLRERGPETIKFVAQLEEEGERIGFWWTDRWPRPKAVLCRGRRSYSLCAKDEESAAYLLDSIDWSGDLWFSALEYRFLPLVRERGKNVQDNPCLLYRLERARFRPFQLPGTDDRPVEPLCREDAGLVMTHWIYGDTEDYPLSRILQAPTTCIRVGGEPVAWALIHYDGSIGMVYTLQEHRRKGYAKAVVSVLAEKRLLAGRTPYCFIVEGNEASEGLFEELGFTLQSTLGWVHCAPEKEQRGPESTDPRCDP